MDTSRMADELLAQFTGRATQTVQAGGAFAWPWRAIERLPRSAQRERVIAFLRDHLQHTPRKRRDSRDLKQLKGSHRDVWQFDIDRSYRLQYTIDDERGEVNVEYIGPHP